MLISYKKTHAIYLSMALATLSSTVTLSNHTTEQQQQQFRAHYTATHKNSLKATTIDLAKLIYNVGKLHIAKELFFHAIPRNYSIVQRRGLISGDGAELFAVCIGVCALLESVYDSYAGTINALSYALHNRYETYKKNINHKADHISQVPNTKHTSFDAHDYTDDYADEYHNASTNRASCMSNNNIQPNHDDSHSDADMYDDEDSDSQDSL